MSYLNYTSSQAGCIFGQSEMKKFHLIFFFFQLAPMQIVTWATDATTSMYFYVCIHPMYLNVSIHNRSFKQRVVDWLHLDLVLYQDSN